MIAAPDLVEAALAASRADGAIVLVAEQTEASLRWAGSSMTTNGMATSRTWSVVSVVGSAVGVVSSASVDGADVEDVVRASEAAARASGDARDATALVEGDTTPADWSDPAARTSVAVFDTLVDDLAAGFRGRDTLYGFAHHTVTTTWLGSSTGLRRRHTEPVGTLELNAKRDGSSAWAGAGTEWFTDVGVAGMLEGLGRRLDWGARRLDLPAGRYETLLPGSAVADLLIPMMWAMDGRGAHEGRTALSRAGGTRLGERLTSLPLTLASDPAAPGLATSPFVAVTSSDDAVSVFDDGLATGRTEWVREGVVNALAYPRATAAELGATPTATGENLLLTGGSGASIDDMVASTERGLLLTCLWYIREVDPATMLLTGLTRDGVYLVEDGRVTGEVGNYRFNESPLDLLRRATEVGADERVLPREWSDWFTRARVGPVRIPDFHMSSRSRAS